MKLLVAEKEKKLCEKLVLAAELGRSSSAAPRQ
jgi:hypothetical protein